MKLNNNGSRNKNYNKSYMLAIADICVELWRIEHTCFCDGQNQSQCNIYLSVVFSASDIDINITFIQLRCQQIWNSLTLIWRNWSTVEDQYGHLFSLIQSRL